MRLTPNLEGDLTWRDVPALVIWVAIMFIGMWLFDMVRSLSVWRELGRLPWWWQLAIRFCGFSIASGLYLFILHLKFIRRREVSLVRYLSGVAYVSVIIGLLASITSFMPWWMFLSLLFLAFITMHIYERIHR